MRKKMILLTLLAISIVISGCVDPYDVSTPDNTATSTSTPQATATQQVTKNVDPAKLLSAPTWTWSSRIRVKEVDVSDDGKYIAGLSTQKVIVKTPTKNLLTNLVWKNANHVSISNDGRYIVVADKYYYNLYDHEGGELHSYNVMGPINHIEVLDNGVVIQGGELKPQMNAVDSYGIELWSYKPSKPTTKITDFVVSDDGNNILIGTQDQQIYYLTDYGEYVWYKSVSGDVLDVEISKDGNTIYVLTDTDKVYSFDRRGSKNWEKALDVNTVEIDITQDGKYILTKPLKEAFMSSFKYKVYLIDDTGYIKWMKQMPHEVSVTGISENGKYVFIGEDRFLRMYNINGDELASYYLDGQFGTIYVSLDMTPDASKVVAGTTNSLLVFG